MNKDWEKELEGLMTLDTLSYSTMSGHPQCKIDPYKLREFITSLLAAQKKEMFIKGYDEGVRVQIDWKYLEDDERTEILNKLSTP